ncbi:MAG: hypothetical protein A3D21_06640 [Nitrospirae bacterium RIFCSPHIGHO2_02_FULL_42_12]|nr:MAG: hypothetical protein A3D21_06640 [Nitrospirae bacterium RIFCSPHIGHO2_02_FULL_42_12]
MIYVPSKVKRHTHKFPIQASLNIVSLMDIFTILLLFLLVNVSPSGEEEAIPVPGIVQLPASSASIKPEPTITVFITTSDIILGDKKIAKIQDVLNSGDSSIKVLETGLTSQAISIADTNKADTKDKDTKSAKKIIIMGDKTIPFTLLKKVMNSCSRAGYSNITLAVLQKENI